MESLRVRGKAALIRSVGLTVLQGCEVTEDGENDLADHINRAEGWYLHLQILFFEHILLVQTQIKAYRTFTHILEIAANLLQ